MGLSLHSTASFKASGTATVAGTVALSSSADAYLLGTIGASGVLSLSSSARFHAYVASGSVGLLRFNSTAKFFGGTPLVVGSLAFSSPVRFKIIQVLTATGTMSLSAAAQFYARGQVEIIGDTAIVSDGVSTWAVNLTTGGHTVYDNFDFLAFFRRGNSYYGVKEDGLYLLAGDDDDGVDINWEINTARVDFKSSTKINVPDATLLGRFSNNAQIIPTIDEETVEGTYIEATDTGTGMHRKRVKLSRGLWGNIWQFRIVGHGPVVLKRADLYPVFSRRTR